MAESQLGIYNKTARHIAMQKLVSLTGNFELLRYANDEWNTCVDYCLEQGFWNFAMRSVELFPSTSIVPTFGYTAAFEKPDDWVRTREISESEFFQPLLNQFNDEASTILASSGAIFMRYVSKDPLYGWNLSRWPASFGEFVGLELAKRLALRVSGKEAMLERLKRDCIKALSDARAKDAMNEPPARRPLGSWVQSRGRGNGGNDGWSR